MYRADYPRCLVVFVLLDDVDVSYLDRLSDKLPDTGIEIAVIQAFVRNQANAR